MFLFKTVVSPLSRMERVRLYLKFLDERSISSFQIQGAVLLRWCITCFSAISILMLFVSKAMHGRNPGSSDSPDTSEANKRWSVDEVYDSLTERQRLIPYALPVAVGVVAIELLRMLVALSQQR